MDNRNSMGGTCSMQRQRQMWREEEDRAVSRVEVEVELSCSLVHVWSSLCRIILMRLNLIFQVGGCQLNWGFEVKHPRLLVARAFVACGRVGSWCCWRNSHLFENLTYFFDYILPLLQLTLLHGKFNWNIMMNSRHQQEARRRRSQYSRADNAKPKGGRRSLRHSVVSAVCKLNRYNSCLLDASTWLIFFQPPNCYIDSLFLLKWKWMKNAEIVCLWSIVGPRWLHCQPVSSGR